MSETVEITEDLLEKLRSPKGGYSRAIVVSLGGSWPLVGGWRKKLIGKRVPAHLVNRILEAAGQPAARVTGQPQPAASLFAPAGPGVPKVEGVLHFDGSCIPNPGPNSQCGFKLHVGSRVIERTIPLGPGTNNTAEYHGIINGMKAALEAGVTHLEVYGDSQLVIRGVARMKGWAKGKPHLEKLKAEAQELVRKFQHVELHWVPREQNAEADALSTRGLELEGEL